ncbi:polyketide synthase [Amylocystis lapponica]|nr:polyketide synthase [Amylocystis lapponica]
MSTMPERNAPPSYSNPDAHALAIVGMSISAPGGEARGLDTEEFYEFLSRRGSGIIEVPADRWNAEAYHGTAPGKIISTKGAFIPEFAYGDLQEFGITPAEAARMKTSQIVLLHQAFNALQRSGVDYRGTTTGVYVGCTGYDLPFEVDDTQVGPYDMTGKYLSITANRINYVYDLLGPSVLVDSACSSALTAMHLALQAIRNGDCEQAVVAGFNFSGPLETLSYSQIGVLSTDGISKSFDDNANGYARGDVAGAVVVKRHDLAVLEHNHVLATVVGSSLTSCGSIMGSLTTPSAEAQTRAIHEAYRDAGLKPYQTDFVELHGTGTVVGDSIEVNAAGSMFSKGRDGHEILIGSVKSNVGHGEMGAYISSLVKVVMMLQHKKVLPNGYFEKQSRKIEFEKYNLRVPVEVDDMVPQDPTLGLIASISSFGIGGACGHTVLRAHEPRPVLPDAAKLSAGPFLFSIGALTPRSCNTLIESYKAQCANVDPLALCDHLGGRARQLPWRTYAVADSLESATFPDPVLVGKRPNPLIFCFSGQGPQHWLQGRVLMATYSVFRDSIYACDKVHEDYTGTSFLRETGLFVDDPPQDAWLGKTLIWPANIISVAITFFQIALFDLLISLGLKPDAVIGHSIGETAVLYASGAMPRDLTVKIAIARGRALSLIDNIGGTMVAISGCDAGTVQGYIDAVFALANLATYEEQELYIAALNSPTDVGVSGTTALVELLVNYISNFADGVTARKLRVSTAVHSPLVDACEAVYRAELELCFAQYKGPFCPTRLAMSSVTGEFKSDSYTIDYLWSNLRRPVLFSTAVPRIIDRFGENATFVEIAPHPVLSQYIKQMGAFDSLPGSVRPPSARQLRAGVKPTTETHALLQTLGRLLVCGVNSINFSVLNGCPSNNFTGPAYPFQGKVWPFAEREPTYLKRLLPPTPPLNSTRLRVSHNIPGPWMGEHVVDQSNIVPAAAYVEMALEFGGVTQVWDCHFQTACALDESAPAVTLEVSKEGNSWAVKSSAGLQTMQGDLEWTRSGPVFDTVHAQGKLGYGQPSLGPDSITSVDVDAVLARCSSSYGNEDFYSEIETVSQFGPGFSRLEKIAMSADEAICWIRGDVEDLDFANYVFYPPLMDAVFQVGLGWNLLTNKINVEGMDRVLYLPHSLRRGYRNDGSTGPLVLPEQFRCYAKLVEWSLDHHVLDAYVLGGDGTVLYTFEGLRFNFLESGERQWPTERYMTHWQPRVLPSSTVEGVVGFDKAIPSVEEIQLLRILDYLAMKYTAATLKILPQGFDPATFDRKAYLAWGYAQAKKLDNVIVPEIPSEIEDKYGVLLELAARIGSAQKDIMKSSTAAVEALFRDDIMSKIYELPPFVGGVFDEAVSNFVQLVKDAVAAGKRVIRVLEVGAGTGRFTALLGQALLDAKLDEICYVDFVSTDISISLAQESCAKSPWPTMTPKSFDLRIPIAQQGLDAGSFDIVVAFDVLHAIPSIRDTLDTLRELLSPGGYLAIIDIDGSGFVGEGIPGTTWMDFVFGCFSEWMGVLESRPGSTHCTLTIPQWKEALEASGFSHTTFLTSAARMISHLVFISQGPQSVPVIDSQLPSDATIKLHSEMNIVRRFEAGQEVELVHFISSLDSSKPYSLWFYTAYDGSTPTLSNSRIVGIVRSIRREYGQWKLRSILFDSSWTVPQQEAYIHERLLPLDWIDPEVLVDKTGVMRVPRIVRAPAPSRTVSHGSYPVEFNETSIWRAYPLPLGPDDVEITTAFVTLSTTFPGCSEFSGTVTALGSNVLHESLLGQRVFGVTRSKPGSVIVCHRSQAALIPSGTSLSEAAAVVGPLVFVTSIVAPAISSAGIKNPRIILHAGSLSPAALATYRYLKGQDVDIFITVNNPSTLCVEGITSKLYDSRQCEVWSRCTREWSKEGVDVAFNFDTDVNVAMETVQVLSGRGSFIQVDGDLPRQTKRGHRYLSIDSHSVLDKESIMDFSISSSTFASLTPPIETFGLSRLIAAHERARVPGSAVLLDVQTVEEELSIYRGGLLKGTAAFDPRATYVIIGGIGGLGVAIARCMVENGARHVVLTSRSGDAGFTEGRLVIEKRILAALRRERGVTIDTVALDCLDVEGTKALFANSPRRIAGVFYLPLLLNDQIFANLTTEDQWKPVSDVKIKGLKGLLEAVDPKSLDFLVLTSSIVTVTGSDGQANYAAAQKEMEATGAQLPNTISIIVPPITDSGAFVRRIPRGQGRNVMHEKYKTLGMSAQRFAEHCVDAIWMLDTSEKNRVYVYMPAMNWKSVASLIPSYGHSFVRHLFSKESTENKVANASKEKSIRETCASVLSMDLDAVEENIPLSSYGLDSLTSVRLSGILKSQFSISVTQLQLLSSYLTVEKLQSMLDEQRTASASEVAHEATALSTSEQSATRSLDQTVIPLNDITEGRPLFMIHGAGGGIGVMRKLAKKIDCPVFGVQDTPEAPITGTLSKLSRFYLSKLKTIQPHGPYRIGGFSFGSTIALSIALLLKAEREQVEMLLMLESAPTLFITPEFQEWTRKRFIENKLQDDIAEVVGDMAYSGVLEDADEVAHQFREHFAKTTANEPGIPWVARFCKAYAAHLMMGLRASVDVRNFLGDVWPADRTVLVRAADGMGMRPYCKNVSKNFDLDKWAPNSEVYELPGTHIGILNPDNGLPALLHQCLEI